MAKPEVNSSLAGNADPAYQERLARWDALGTEMNRASEVMYGSKMEPGISEVAIGINAILGGYYTNMSCEGHDDETTSFPWVSFNGGDSTQLSGLKGLLSEFYGERDSSAAVRLQVYDWVMGSAAHTLMAEIAHRYQTNGGGEQALREAAMLGAQQREMTDFAAFLKEKYLAGHWLPASEASGLYEPETGERSTDEYPGLWSYDISKVLGALLRDGEPVFDPETVAEIAELDFETAFETAYGYLVQAGFDADAYLAPWMEHAESDAPNASDKVETDDAGNTTE